jgi:hypothetical protein
VYFFELDVSAQGYQFAGESWREPPSRQSVNRCEMLPARAEALIDQLESPILALAMLGPVSADQPAKAIFYLLFLSPMRVPAAHHTLLWHAKQTCSQ